MFKDSNDYSFIKAVDEIILSSETNSNLDSAIKNIDAEAQSKGLTLYEMIYNIMQHDLIDERIKEWIRDCIRKRI